MTNEIYECSANPAVQRPYSTTKWFIDPPADKPDKFQSKGGNDVKLLNCGENYLPELYTALEGATKSIYIAIWGFNPHLYLKLNSNDEQYKFGHILQRKAEKGIKVKILVWHDIIANTFSWSAGDSSLHKGWIQGWNQKAMSGKFKNIEFMTRNPKGEVFSSETKKELEKIDSEMAEILTKNAPKSRLGLRSYNRPTGYPKRYIELQKKRTLLKKVGYGAYKAHSERIDDEGLSYNNIGKFPTHHQKTVLIDHEIPDEAIGFVQGFNFWPKYFDETTHPYRGTSNRIQDVGLRLKGRCLIDIYNNFSQSWNREVATWNHPLKPIPESQPIINPKGNYNCQILRTWRDDDEFNINAFYMNALSKLNHFIYVEDQYFRQPEFVVAIKKRAKQLKSKCGDKKLLHVFAITNLNKEAVGGG